MPLYTGQVTQDVGSNGGALLCSLDGMSAANIPVELSRLTREPAQCSFLSATGCLSKQSSRQSNVCRAFVLLV